MKTYYKFFLIVFSMFCFFLRSENAEARKAQSLSQKELHKIINKELGDCDCRKRTIKSEIKNKVWHVVITDDGIQDDETRAERIKGRIIFEGEKWVLKKDKILWQGWPGRGDCDLSQKHCPWKTLH